MISWNSSHIGATAKWVEHYQKRFNEVFERELSGYRFVSGQLVPIASPQEVAAVEDAIESAAIKGLSGASRHLETALEHLGKKPEPDYRNAIKESISAVESVTKQITGIKAGGLEAALGKLADATKMHGALKDAFLKLFGYTSDSGGIRHGLLNGRTPTYDEAKFMIVACSAFVNYLIGTAIKAGLLRTTAEPSSKG